MQTALYAPNQDGIFRMSPEAYRKADGISKHSLDLVADCPLALDLYRRHGSESTELMEFGTLCHTAVLEPHLFPGSYHLRPETYASVDKKTKAITTKEWSGNSTTCRNWVADHKDKTVLRNDDLKRLLNICKSVTEHPVVGPMMQQGEGVAEVSMFATCPETGLRRKGRCDWITCADDGTWFMVDLKFVNDATERGFRRQFEDLRYFVQAAYYVDLMKLINGVECQFIFVAVETQPMNPRSDVHRVQAYRVFTPHLDTGRAHYLRDLRRYRECLESGQWPSDTDTIKTLGLSPWFLRQNAL